MAGKKEGRVSNGLNSGQKKLILGIVIGAVIVAVIALFIMMPIYSERYEQNCVAGEEKINFDVKDVHLSIKEDFASGLPVYDGGYCKNEFLEKYGREAFSCVLSRIKTYSRINPMVVEVGCICE